MLSLRTSGRRDRERSAAGPSRAVCVRPLVALLVLPTAACFANPEAPAFVRHAVVVGESQVDYPVLSGDRVVWRGFDLDLEAEDLRTGRRWTVAAADSSGQGLAPALDGTVVAWLVFRPDSAGERRSPVVAVGDIRGDPPKLMTEPPIGFRDGRPDVSRGRVVWSRVLGRDSAVVYLYDVSTGRTRALTGGRYRDRSPRIDGDRVVFERFRDAATASAQRTDIMLLDLGTGRLRKLNPHEGANQGSPDVSGDIVAWAENANGTSDLVYVDLATGRFVNVTRDHGRVTFGPRIAGSRVVWNEEGGLLGQDVYVYNLRTGRKTRLTEASGDQLFPDVGGDRVVWVDAGVSPPRLMSLDLSGGT